MAAPDSADRETLLREAAGTADLTGTVSSFAEGYDTMVGERGVTLSGGQKQRTAIAQTLVRDVPVMIFDDSLSAVDAETDARIRAALKKETEDATVILIAHRITTLMHADRIFVMDKGRIQQVAGPLEIYERPANRFVAGFIGTPPMNLFPKGTLSGSATVGLRPENIALGRGTLRATVDFTESLGSETLVHVVAEGVPAIVRVGGFSSVRHGESVMLEPDMSKAVEFRD
jgi:ABC-type sugar transport system ATPase subunit